MMDECLKQTTWKDHFMTDWFAKSLKTEVSGRHDTCVWGTFASSCHFCSLSRARLQVRSGQLSVLTLAGLAFVAESAVSLHGQYKLFREAFTVMDFYRNPVLISHFKGLHLSLMLPWFCFCFLWMELQAEAGPCGASQNLLNALLR